MATNTPTPQAVTSLLRQQLAEEGTSGFDTEAVVRYGSFVGSVIESHCFLPRAMDHGRSLILQAAESNRSIASGTVILADTMSRSKGRFDRSWHAPLGGVWGCMIHGNTLLPQSRRFIPFAVGLSCCEAMRGFGAERALIRWVNDVLIEGRKVAGFLVEGYCDPVHGEEFTLVGFGININNHSFPPELSDTAVSLSQVLGKAVDVTDFTTFFLARLAWNFGLLCYEEARELRGEKFSGPDTKHLLVHRWRNCSDSVGRKVIYGFDVMKEPLYRARVERVDDEGGLVMLLEDGFKKTEYAGEIRYLDEVSGL